MAKFKKYQFLCISFILFLVVSICFRFSSNNSSNEDINVDGDYVTCNSEPDLENSSNAIVIAQVLNDFEHRKHIVNYLNTGTL